MRIPITSLTQSPAPGMMVLTDSCRNQYYVFPDSVVTGGDVTNQYFSGDTLITILANGDTLISISNNVTGVNYQNDTLCIFTAQGDTFCTFIQIDADTSGTGRFRLLDNLGVQDTLWTNAAPATPDLLSISNAVRLDLPNTLKWGGRLVDPTTTIQSMDSTHNITYQSVNIMRHYGASMRFYPWDRFLIDGTPGAYIDMRSRSSFYIRADTVLHLDLFQHGLSDTSYLLIRTDRLRKSIAKQGALLQLLQHGSGTHQGNADWTNYQFPLAAPQDTGDYVLSFENGEFTFKSIQALGAGEINVGLNIGPGEEIYAGKSDTTLLFRTLVGGGATTVTQQGDSIIISTPTGGGGGQNNTGQNIGPGEEIYAGKSDTTLLFRTLVGDGGTTVTQQGDSIIISSPDADPGRIRLADNLGVSDTLFANPDPLAADLLSISNAVRLDLPNTLKWGGDLVDATTTIHSPDSSHNVTYQDVNIMRHYGASMRFYPWDRFIIDGTPGAYIDMRSKSSFYVRADTVLHLDLYQHGLSDTSYLLIRTDRLRKSIAKQGALLQLLQHGSGTHQGNADWTKYQFPLSAPQDTGNYVLKFDGDKFTFQKSNDPALLGGGTLNYLAKWTPNGNTLGNSQVFDNGTNVGIGTITPTSRVQINAYGSTGGTSPLSIFSSNGDNVFNFQDNGQLNIGATTGYYATIRLGTTQTIRSDQGIVISPFGTSLRNGVAITMMNNFNGIVHPHSLLNLSGGFVVSSGSNPFSVIRWEGTINQTGSASGKTHGIYLKPNLISATNWYSIEAVGKAVFAPDTGYVAPRYMNIYGTARITGSVDTATVAHVWTGNPQGDLRKVNLGGDIIIQGDSIKVNVPSLPGGTVLNSTLRWNGTIWEENDSLLVNEKGEAAFGGVAINTTRSITTSKDITVNTIRIGRGQSNNQGNIAIGDQALNNPGAQDGCVAMGKEALKNTIAWGNTAIGPKALMGIVGGQSNTAVGDAAAHFGTGSGSFNVFFGRLNARSSTSSYNSVVGAEALYSQTSSGSNTAMGFQALYTLTGAGVTFNTVTGTEAGRNATGIIGSSFYGAGSGYNSTSKHSIFLGRNSGFSVTKDSTLIIQSSSDTIATIVGDLGQKKVGINRGPNGISRTLDVGGDLRVRTDVDTASLTRLWAGNPQGDLKRVWVGDGLGFVGDTLKATSIYVPVPEPYVQANANVAGYNDTINASQAKPIKFSTVPWVHDWVKAGDILEYQGLDTFMAKIHVELSVSADAATTGQLVFYSNDFGSWTEMFGEEVTFNAGASTITISNHTLYGVPLVNSIVGADEFGVYLKNTSANTRIFTIHRAKISIVKVADWDPSGGN